MALAVVFALTVLCIGFGVLRLLGVARGASGLGLAPVAGLAAAATASSWCAVLGAPPPVGASVLYGLALVGLGLVVADRGALLDAGRTLAREQRVAGALLLVALTVPLVAMGFAFAGAEVPLSPHDGAAHTEMIEAYRLGHAWSSWYPPGTAALFAAWLQALPWVDSAAGALDLGLSLPSLAAMTVFGLGVAVWRDPRIAANASLLLSFTYLYPYFPQLWSGWPLAISVILALGMWTVALEYVRHASARWGILAGLVLGAIVLVHGTELYSLLIVLPIVLIGAHRRVIWGDLARVFGLALLVALVCALVYLPGLLRWAGAGGAYAVGLQETSILTSNSTDGTAAPGPAGPSLFVTFALDALGIDLPLRLLLLAIGIGWSIRQHTGRSVVAVGSVFALVAVALNAWTDMPVLRQLYALTFPWGMHYRLLMLVAVAQALLAGAGGVVLVTGVTRWASRASGGWGRRVGRIARILVVTWVGLTTSGLALFMAYPASQVVGYSSDDAAAMAWLREHAAPGEVVLNDASADAGIWAPYKAGVPILLPRSAPLSAEELSHRQLVWQNVASLDSSQDIAADACAEHVTYVYYGARVSGWDTRHFPPLEKVAASTALEEVFRQGQAAVLRKRLSCS